MDNTLLVAKILGVYMLASGLVLIFQRKSLPIMLKDLFEHRALTWIAGFVLIVIGGLIVWGGGINNSWVIFLGWLILLKGVLYIIYPEILTKVPLLSKRSFTLVWGLLSVAVGVWLVLL